MFTYPALLRTANRVLAAAGTGDPGSGQAGSAGGASSASTGSGTGQSTTSGQQSGQQSGQDGGQSATSTSATPTPTTPDIRDGDWRTLRQRYDERGNLLATYKKLGEDPAKLEASLKVYNTYRSAAWEVAQGLGYEEADFEEALASNPERTMQVLRQQQAEAQRTNQPVRQDGKSLEDTIKDIVSRQTQPFNQHINRQMTEQAMTRYNNEFTALVSADPILKDAPPEVHELVKDYLEENLQHNPAKLEGMKLKGDFAFLKDDVTLVANRLQGVFTKWLSKTQAKTGNTQPGIRPGQAAKKPSLDDIINSPELLGDQYK